MAVYEPPHDKTNKMACAPSEDSDQPGHSPSLITVFAVRMKKAWVLTYPMREQRRLRSDWVDAQVDLCLRWAHSHFVGFVMRRLISVLIIHFRILTQYKQLASNINFLFKFRDTNDIKFISFWEAV